MWQIIAAVLLLGGAVAFIGDTFTTRANAKYVKAQQEAKAERDGAIGGWVSHLRDEQAAADERVKNTERERDTYRAQLEKERVKNVTPFAVKSCVLTAGVVQQHNNAAAGRSAGNNEPGAVFTPDAPAGIGIDRYSAAVEGNYGTCHKWMDRAKEWQRFAAQTCRDWNAKWKRSEPCPPFPGGADGQPQKQSGPTETKGR